MMVIGWGGAAAATGDDDDDDGVQFLASMRECMNWELCLIRRIHRQPCLALGKKITSF